MKKTMRVVWSSWCCAAFTLAACGSPPSGGPIDASVDAGPAPDAPDADVPPAFTLELLAGDIRGAGNVDGTGTAARLRLPSAVAVDGAGNLYIADTSNSTLRKVSPIGVVTTFAGRAGVYGTADGVGTAARFDFPAGVATDSAGNVYVADTNNSMLRKITASGVVTTVAGAVRPGSADGPGAVARFRFPAGVAVDASGNIYVADTGNATIRRITSGGVVTTLAGAVDQTGSTDGIGAAARFNRPTAVAADAAGNLYVADQNNHVVRKVTAGGVVTTLAGTAGVSGSADGTGAAARFDRPAGVAVDAEGNVHVADQNNHVVRKVTAAGVVTTLAGSAGVVDSVDGVGSEARFNRPLGVAVDGAGNVYVADASNHLVRRVTADAVVTTLVGAAEAAGGTDGTGSAARFRGPSGIAIDGAGVVYVADVGNATIRKVAADGAVTTLAGSAGATGSVDGAGTAARFDGPSGVAVDRAGNVYVADQNNHTIRKITADGAVTTLAGAPGVFGNADGVGSAAQFNFPFDLTMDSAGNLYVADQNNHTIRKVTADGVVTTLAGAPGMFGALDGVGAAARFAFPSGLAVDGAGNVYVSDHSGSTIRRITPAGVVTTLAGTAFQPGTADGVGSAARFMAPFGIAVDLKGNVFVSDNQGSTIRRVTPGGVTATVAGDAGTTGIQLGTSPRLAFPRGLAMLGDALVVSDANAVLLLRPRTP